MRSFLPIPLLLHALAATTLSAAELPKPVAAFLDQHCLECHDDLSSEGDLDLLDTDFDFTDPANYHLWSTIHRRVEAGEMPPEEKDRPEAEALDAFLKEVSGKIAAVERARYEQNGRAKIRRLSRNEYENTLRDLLHLPELRIADSLPPEGSAHGYDKSAEALDFSHVHARRLMEIADESLRKAIAPAAEKPPVQTWRFDVHLRDPKNLQQNCGGLHALVKQSNAMPLIGKEVDTTITRIRGNFLKRDPGSITDHPPHFDALALFINGEFNLGMAIKPFKAPVPGYYKLRVNGFGLLNDHGKVVPSDRPETIGFYSNDRTLGYVDIPPNEASTVELKVWLDPDDVVKPLVASAPFPRIQIPVKGKPGEPFTSPEAYTKFRAHGVAFRWFEMEGPFYDDEEWPPASHRQLFGDLPIKMSDPKKERGETIPGEVIDVVSEDALPDARRLLRRFLGQALRRPVTPEDMKVPIAVVNKKLRRKENFMESMISGYRAVLTSPDFLLLGGEPGQLNDHALAERLSYFLTNSPPDGPLQHLANTGKLRPPEELKRQVNRLLGKPESARFVEHFLDKWLKLEDIALTEPDANLYPDYTPLLMDSSLWETRAYFSEMLGRDLNAAHVANSDFAMVNQRLAELYEIPGITGNEIRKVSLPKNSVRGGLLTQASVLKTTANGTVTSPVVRGDYVQVHFLGDPPPPPPPSVPAVEPDISGATTIREQLARHSEDQSCAACHAKIDPPGFALEGFDVMGGFRKRYRSLDKGDPIEGLLYVGKPANTKLALPVDSSGELPDGSTFRGIRDFKAILLKREEQIARNLMEQLITYSTGAPVSFADQEILNQLMQQSAATHHGVRSMIHHIVQSPLFLEK